MRLEPPGQVGRARHVKPWPHSASLARRVGRTVLLEAERNLQVRGQRSSTRGDVCPFRRVRGCNSSWGQSGYKGVVHVGPDKFTNSCDAIRRIVDCTLDQIVSPYQRVVCADV
jgi:hypothetical protein